MVPYTITKPVMQIQSASVQALYYKCGNKLSVQVPALGAQYQPSFSRLRAPRLFRVRKVM